MPTKWRLSLLLLWLPPRGATAELRSELHLAHNRMRNVSHMSCGIRVPTRWWPQEKRLWASIIILSKQSLLLTGISWGHILKNETDAKSCDMPKVVMHKPFAWASFADSMPKFLLCYIFYFLSKVWLKKTLPSFTNSHMDVQCKQQIKLIIFSFFTKFLKLKLSIPNLNLT